ncbi:distal membrane-arm assembly complex protein 2-like [Sceloporus undulatus]|uniref:distal membrane-arm assembly complex protein 2-like n=1 Tax=Sceloporus undulatus TaxID=8520 RepID=UPI001C4B603C|nr:distal membrane-arm assembly complex protein 2-like [Sceloporus undulatus]XP_042299616.1 distal membrane-arm assembly complex protein 2-like [Sceloporus undulatus]
MAAPMLLRHCRGVASLLYSSSRYNSSSTGSTAKPLKIGILQYLCDRFYDVETFVDVGHKLKKWNIQRKNSACVEVCQRFGDEVGAAVFALNLKGRIRAQGQNDWYQDSIINWKNNLNFQEYNEVLLEAVDLSGSIINYNGLDNLVKLKALKHLVLSRCPHIDDWSLSRLHAFADTLEELSLAGCPQITERGLACLHHLQNLKRLDVSDLPSVSKKGLVRILLEEMLPQCDIVGMDYGEDMDLQVEDAVNRGKAEEPQEAASNLKTY